MKTLFQDGWKEMNWKRKPILKVPMEPRLYLIAVDDTILYVGASRFLRSRFRAHKIILKKLEQLGEPKFFTYTPGGLDNLFELERFAISKYQPLFNRGWARSKRENRR